MREMEIETCTGEKAQTDELFPREIAALQVFDPHDEKSIKREKSSNEVHRSDVTGRTHTRASCRRFFFFFLARARLFLRQPNSRRRTFRITGG